MFKIYIQGLQTGENKIQLTEEASVFKDKHEKFTRNVVLEGTLFKNSFKYTLKATITATALLTCDRTLEEFEEPIEAEMRLELFENLDKDRNKLSEEDVVIIEKEDKYVDITDKVYEELVLSLPMRRLSPKVRHLEFGDLYPELSADEQMPEKEELRNQWAALKNLKLN